MKKLKLIATVGGVASGKTTWANEFVKNNPNYRKVERDDLRVMLFGTRWTGNNTDEQIVSEIQYETIKILFKNNYNVIVSDTNLNPKSRDSLRELADLCWAEFEVNDSFLNVSLETCIQNDKNRGSLVGEEAIRKVHSRWIEKKKENWDKVRKYEESRYFLVKQNDSLPKCIMVDIDGTLTLGPENRSAFEWHKVGQDLPNYYMIDILKMYYDSYDSDVKIFILSGRDGICREETIRWLEKFIDLKDWNNVPKTYLIMRPEGDNRPDTEVKKEMYQKYIQEKYYVQCVYDDRQKVVDMWRKECGLFVCQVNYGDF